MESDKINTIFIILVIDAPEETSDAVDKDPNLTLTGKKTKKVLLIDDNEDLLTVMKLMLKAENYEISTANDGKMVLEVFPDFQPDFAIVDIGLPDMDGFELGRQLMASGADNSITKAYPE